MHQPIRKRIDTADIAEVKLQTQHVDARNSILPAIRVARAGSQGCRRLGRMLGVLAQGPDCLERFGLGSRRGEEDKVGG